MNEAAVLQWFHESGFGVLMVKVTWLFAVFETVHFIGLSIMMGALIVMDLTVMGFLPGIPLARALKLVPFALLGFALNLISGAGFFCFNPGGYWSNPAFRLKMLAVVLAGFNAAWFIFFEQHRLLARDSSQTAPWSAKTTAALSLLLWLAVMLAGRLLPTFQTTGTG